MKNINDNRFFRRARQKASGVLKNQERLKQLINVSAAKLKEVNMSKIRDSKVVDRIRVVIRMVKAYKNGDYRAIRLQSILLLVAALLYFVTPIDLVPDFIPITGLVDDFTVMVWVYSKLQEEIDRFIVWENESAQEA